MLKIKLSPRGKKHQVTYRIVVTQDRTKLNGSFIDDLGFYTPQTKTLEINQEKMAKWIKDGAQITLGVDKLLNPNKYPKKIKKKKEAKVIKPEVPKEEIVNSEPVEAAKQEAVETPVEEVKVEEKTEEVKEEVIEKSE